MNELAVRASDAERERTAARLGDATAEGRLTLDTPLVRVVSVSVFAGLDVWRVPTAWRDRSRRQIIRAIRKGEHRELEE